MHNSKKYKMLAWSDSVLASTGFGVVSKNVLKELYKTGKYDIDQLAINYYGEFYDTKEYPYQLSPAKLLEPSDPFGNRMFIRALQKNDYDIVWILNDTFVVEGVVPSLKKVLDDKRAQGRKVPKIIFYYPVDCAVIPDFSGMIKLADVAVCITEHGKTETLKTLPNLDKEIKVIYHGCDNKIFHPIDSGTRQFWRNRQLGVKDSETFVVINVNRNSVRKDIPRSILAFKKFKDQVPNSVMYVHCAPRDNSIDLIQACKSLGLQNKTDVIFPGNFNLADGGFPIEALNNFYNAADCFLTTTLGEGWGLTITEAMACGTPVIAPNNTSIPELLGEDGDRGYVYECTDETWIDNSGFRPVGKTNDIVNKMLKAYNNRKTKAHQDIIARAAKFIDDHTWDKVCKPWVKIFDDALTPDSRPAKVKLQEV